MGKTYDHRGKHQGYSGSNGCPGGTGGCDRKRSPSPYSGYVVCQGIPDRDNQFKITFTGRTIKIQFDEEQPYLFTFDNTKEDGREVEGEDTVTVVTVPRPGDACAEC